MIMEFTPVKFYKSLEKLRVQFPLPEEIAAAHPDEAVLEKLEGRIRQTPFTSIHRLALSLSNSDLGMVLHLLASCGNDGLVPEGSSSGLSSKIYEIIRIRVRKDFFYINWAMIQYYPCNTYLEEAMDIICQYVKQEYRDEFESMPISRIAALKGEEMIAAALSSLNSGTAGVEEFVKDYRIILDSPFAAKILIGYFSDAEKNIFVRNEAYLRKLFLTLPECPKWHCDIMESYLLGLGITDYSDDLNGLILDNCGKPGADSLFWQTVSKDAQKKFKGWLSLKTIGSCYGEESRKYNFWKSYADYITRFDVDKTTGVAFMHFKDFVVVDMSVDEPTEYMYKLRVFNIAYAEYLSASGNGRFSKWSYQTDKALSARVITEIEDTDAEVYRLEMEDVGILHARRLLDMKV